MLLRMHIYGAHINANNAISGASSCMLLHSTAALAIPPATLLCAHGLGDGSDGLAQLGHAYASDDGEEELAVSRMQSMHATPPLGELLSAAGFHSAMGVRIMLSTLSTLCCNLSAVGCTS